MNDQASLPYPLPIDIDTIRQLIPQDYPFLFVDRVVDYKPGEFLHGIKNVTINEPAFPGHFPGLPVMPGVLILEAMAQAAALLLALSGGGADDERIFYLGSINKARFRHKVRPGDQLFLEVNAKAVRMHASRVQCCARVDEVVVCEAEITSISDRDAG